MREFFLETHTIEWEAFGESLPHPGCDVTLDPEVKDRFGLRVARLRTAVHPASLAASDFLAGRARAIVGAIDGGAGTRARPVALPVEERIYGVLQAGTARMGRDPSRSVIDASGQAHEVKNLYVADASGFPSSSGAPFTLTIMANALRVASRIAERGRAGKL
jgi:choline dehydrogenase-like flavoprotein